MTDPLIGWTTETLRFDRLLGKGGMGSVYQAVQVQMNRKVAVKVVAPHLFDDPSYRERFTREAQTLGRLVHHNIIGAHDFGPITGPDGKELFVMVLEFVNGWNLGTLLKEKRLSVRQVLNLHAQAADGLAFAHSVGVIHRDIKPDNLMVTRKGVCKLADFGLARAEDSVQVTATGAIIGSPAYMSPEACRGDQPTAASDVYSLGCSLFQSLTDNMPYPGNQSLAVLQAHITQPVPSLLLYRPDLGRIDGLLHKILAKKPGDRPTAAELVKLLRDEADQVPESLIAGRLRANTQVMKPKPGTVHTEISQGVSIRSAARPWSWWLVGIAVSALVILAGIAAYRSLRKPTSGPVEPPSADAPVNAAVVPAVDPGTVRAADPAPKALEPVEKGRAPVADPVNQLLDRAEELISGGGANGKESIRRFLEAKVTLEDIPRLHSGELSPDQTRRLMEIRGRMEAARKAFEERKNQGQERLHQVQRAALEKAALEKAAQEKAAAGKAP